TKIASLLNELQSNIYKNSKLRTQLFKKVSDQKDHNQDSSKNAKFAKQPIAEILSKIGETNALSKPVTSNSVSTPQVSKVQGIRIGIERLLKAVASQDIMIIVQNESDVEVRISDLQTELERTKERFENCIIKKENEYAKLWNDWYKKCDECKYDKISYDKAYKDMQQKIKRLQAQLGDLKGKSTDTSCILDTRNRLSQKLKNENVELKF
nr:hypothetical protein [Tanacetum cinerariifolium]